MIIIPDFESLEKEILDEFRKFNIGKDNSDCCRTTISFNNEDLWFVEKNSRFIDSRKKEISIFYKIPDVGKPNDSEIPEIPKELKIITTVLVRYDSLIRRILHFNKNFQWEVLAYSGTQKTFNAEANNLKLLIKVVNDKIKKEFESINNFILDRENALSLRNRIVESMFSYEG